MSTRLPANQYADSGNLSARANLHAQYSTNPQGWGNWLFQQIKLKDHLTILDVGCGPGGLWRSHLGCIPANAHLVLTDLSPGMVSEAENVLPDKRFEFRVADAQALPYPNGSFDCVVANHMLYHVPDLDGALSEIARVLNPQGTLYAATNGVSHMRQLHEAIRLSIPEFAVLTGSFTLENGSSVLERHFGEVSVRRYEDHLVVPDADALSAYVRSMASVADATDRQLDEIEQRIRDQIVRDGSMEIEKAAGLFIAKEPREAEQGAEGDAVNRAP
ncbi:MAG: methyltransferase domain-containing protein [Kiritimatiellae bacterium]|nr:methyltransferase domain-containing protein [Kiritimatiellia bacterium]